MKNALYLIAGIITVFMLLVLFNWMCLSDVAQAQADPTPTPETWQLSQYGYLGLPKAQVSFPTRLEPMCWKDGVWCVETTHVWLKGAIVDWSAREIHWFYQSAQGCYELVYSASGGFGPDGNPHPDRGAWWVECG